MDFQGCWGSKRPKKCLQARSIAALVEFLRFFPIFQEFLLVFTEFAGVFIEFLQFFKNVPEFHRFSGFLVYQMDSNNEQKPNFLEFDQCLWIFSFKIEQMCLLTLLTGFPQIFTIFHKCVRILRICRSVEGSKGRQK